MNKIFPSLMLATTISLANIGTVTNEYINHNLDILKRCENKQFVKENVGLIKDAIESLKTSNNDFSVNVIEYTMQNAPVLLKENPAEVQNFVKILISHLDSKINSYKQIEKVFNRIDKAKSYKNDLKELESKAKEMKSDILHLSRMTFLSLDAQEIFTRINEKIQEQKLPIVLEDYWHNIDTEEEYKVLFVKIKDSENFDYDEISNYETSLNELLSKFKQDKKNAVERIKFGSKATREYISDSKFSLIAIA